MIERFPDASTLPLSSAVRVGNLVFASGHVAQVDSTASLEDEITQALRNLESSLRHAGAELNRVVKANVFLDKLEYAEVANVVYRRFFSNTLPARSTVCARLIPPYRYEIEAIAHVDNAGDDR